VSAYSFAVTQMVYIILHFAFMVIFIVIAFTLDGQESADAANNIVTLSDDSDEEELHAVEQGKQQPGGVLRPAGTRGNSPGDEEEDASSEAEEEEEEEEEEEDEDSDSSTESEEDEAGLLFVCSAFILTVPELFFSPLLVSSYVITYALHKSEKCAPLIVDK
jgi:hypothetical protein